LGDFDSLGIRWGLCPTRADAVGKLEWIVNVDATVNNRAHQPFAGQ
jgi:hypothetical protein